MFDTVVVIAKFQSNEITTAIMSVIEIKLNNESREIVDSSQISECEITGTCMLFNCADESNLIWNGEYGSTIIVPGILSMQIKFELKSIDGKNKMFFNKNDLIEINKYLSASYREQVDSNLISQIKQVNLFSSSLDILNLFKLGFEEETVITSKCKICSQKCKLNRMRQHIGRHLILNGSNHNLNTCGYCGGTDCSIEIKSSGRGKSANKTPFSNCSYFVKFSLGRAATLSNYSPCSNRPIECPSCKLIVWSYNLKIHYDFEHEFLEFPRAFVINDSEIKAIKKYVN